MSKIHTTIIIWKTNIIDFIDISKHFIIQVPWESRSFENEGLAFRKSLIV